MMIHGNRSVIELLTNAVRNGRVHHALLFHGPDGVGKFSTALNLVQQLNCKNAHEMACGECSSCRRMAAPFPFHPDLQIYREVQTPVFLHRSTVLNRFIIENRLDPETDLRQFLQQYEQTLTDLHSKGVLIKHMVCTKANPKVDILQFNRKTEFSQTLADGFGTTMMGAWLAKKLQGIRTSSAYSKSFAIDAVRAMQKTLFLHTFESEYKAVIIDDADRMLPAAQNCLLKTLEEPPGNTVIILIVMNPSGLLSTIRSRCQLIPFKRLAESDLVTVLTEQFGFSGDDARLFAPRADGSVAEALATDWELSQHTWNVFEQMFTDPAQSASGWAMEIAQVIMELNESGSNTGIIAFERWLHHRICSHADAAVLPGKLPGNRRFHMDEALFIMDGLTKIKNNALYHIDLQLNLETLMIKMLNTESQVN